MKILLPHDGSLAAMQAVRLVAGWQGDKTRISPVLLNVDTPPLKWSAEPGIDPELLGRALREQGMASLEPASAILRESELSFERLFRLGRPSDTIIDVAREIKADAIVMGTRGHGAISGFALGSVALRVTQGASLPVVLVKPDSRLPLDLGRGLRVVAPVDGSRASAQAVLGLAATKGVLGRLQVHLVHFQVPLTFLEAVVPPHDDVLRRWAGAEADDALMRARRILSDAGIDHEVHLLAGDPATGIAGFASETDADAVAMSMHGAGALRNLLLGSVALKTAHLSPVPVLFLPPAPRWR